MMATLPAAGDGPDLAAFEIKSQPGRTHRLDLARNRTRGMTDGKEAVLQAVYLALSTERYAYPIYSRNYGVELADLVGQPRDYAMSEIKRRITEALEQDDRVTGVDGWTFEEGPRSVRAAFVVHTVCGDVEAEKEAEI